MIQWRPSGPVLRDGTVELIGLSLTHWPFDHYPTMIVLAGPLIAGAKFEGQAYSRQQLKARTLCDERLFFLDRSGRSLADCSFFFYVMLKF